MEGFYGVDGGEEVMKEKKKGSFLERTKTQRVIAST